jgi:hypothetical protein
MTSEKISEKISPSNLSGLLSSRVLPALFGNETSLLCEQKKEEKRLRERPDFANYVPFKSKVLYMSFDRFLLAVESLDLS